MNAVDDENELPVEFAEAVSESNWKEALEICEYYAKNGNASAEHTLGWFYEQGIEVPQSDEKAFLWWSISASKGIPESQAGLGTLYLNGRGANVNYQKAYYWLSLAIRNGENHSKAEAIKAKKELTLWQYLYAKFLLLKT